MGRTRRVVIDLGFDTSGSEWTKKGIGELFNAAGYREFALPFVMRLGGQEVQVASVTLWENGVVSLGPATQIQIDFLASGQSPIPNADGTGGFPGEFFVFDYRPGISYDFFTYASGVVDYTAPYLRSEQVNAIYFTMNGEYDSTFQIVLDQNGFSILRENFVTGGSGINGYSIGSETFFAQDTVIEFDKYPEFFTYPGSVENDLLVGSDFNDVFLASPGLDVAKGGLGNDIYFMDASGDVVIEALNEGYDTVFSTVNFTLPANVERAIVDGVGQSFAINFVGNALANELAGNAGANVLDGGTGADLMTGYAGDDVYFVDNAGDVIIEGVGAGFDTVFAIFNYTLGDNVERVVTLDPGSTAPLNFTGNALANEMTGNAGANILDGGAGADLMIGGAGNDIYFVDNTGDVVSDAPGGGYDTVFTTTNFLLNSLIERVVALDNNSPTHVTLIGNEFANEITGSGGSNLIDGGLGADLLMGGAGGDAFRFSTALGSGNIDALPDFQVGTDKIYLDHAIFAALAAGSLTAGAFRAGSAAGDADDRIIYDPVTGKLYYDADGNGAGAAVQFAVLHEGLSLSAGDFYVV